MARAPRPASRPGSTLCTLCGIPIDRPRAVSETAVRLQSSLHRQPVIASPIGAASRYRLHAARRITRLSDSAQQRGAGQARSNMNLQRQATARGAKRRAFRPAVLHAAVICACGAAGIAQAFDIDTGNDDLTARWDNTLALQPRARASRRRIRPSWKPECRRRRPQFQQGLAGHQPAGPAVGVRPRLAAQVRPAPERRGLV